MPLGELQAVCQSLQELVRIEKTCYSKLTQSESGQTPKEITER